MLKLWWLYKSRNYWAQRAADLEEKLEKERTSNRRYEREMTSRMLTMAGQMGIPQEKETRKQQREPPAAAPPLSQATLGNLTPQQAEDWQMYKEDAAANEVGENVAWNDFFQREILSKMTLMDDDRVDVEN